MEPSPYLPTTRRFVNPIYLRRRADPRVRRPDRRPTGPRVARRCTQLRRRPGAADRIDRDTAWTAKRRRAADRARGAADAPAASSPSRRYRTREGERARRLRHLVRAGRGARHRRARLAGRAAGTRRSRPWRGSATRARRRGRLRPLAAVGARRAARRDPGRAATGPAWALGVMHDLAVGVHPERRRRLGAAGRRTRQGVTVGAPPDPYNQNGQDWSQPPWRPDRLAEHGVRAVPAT